MLSRKAQLRNFLKTILSDGKTELIEGSNWEDVKGLAQEARSLGYILCEFKKKDYILEPEKIINITVTMKGENFCRGRS